MKILTLVLVGVILNVGISFAEDTKVGDATPTCPEVASVDAGTKPVDAAAGSDGSAPVIKPQ